MDCGTDVDPFKFGHDLSGEELHCRFVSEEILVEVQPLQFREPQLLHVGQHVLVNGQPI